MRLRKFLKKATSNALAARVVGSKSSRHNEAGDLDYCIAHGNLSIFLPADHMLPTYQRHHAKYDKFLPHLVSSVEGTTTIIDVGANCGDTLAGMLASNPRLSYLCIEPDDIFFEYLRRNVERLRSQIASVHVEILKNLVGKNVRNVALVGSGGTKHAVEGKGDHNSRSIDAMLSERGNPHVQILKSDVDGYDYDVIASAERLIRQQFPLIFFECQYETFDQRIGFEQIIVWLSSVGYVDWIVFDNFGEVMLRTDNINNIIQLMNYVWKQNVGQTTRTIHYFDILAGCHNHSKQIDHVLRSY